MAQRTQVILEDDIDGGDASETVRFGLDGVAYEIDLNKKNAAKLRDALAAWVSHGRRTGGRRQRGTGGGDSGGSAQASRSRAGAMRAWAQEKGYQVSDRGRIPADIQEAYDKAH